MRKILILCTLNLFTISCSNSGSNSKACNQIGAINNLAINLGSDESITGNIAFAINGEDIDFDQCASPNLPFDPYTLHTSEGGGLEP